MVLDRVRSRMAMFIIAAIAFGGCGQPTGQPPAAGETNFRVVVLGPDLSPMPNVTVALRVMTKSHVPIVVDSTSGLTNASGEFAYRRSYPLGGRYPTVVEIEPPEYVGLYAAVVHDSTEWSSHPAALRTLTVTLIPNHLR